MNYMFLFQKCFDLFLYLIQSCCFFIQWMSVVILVNYLQLNSYKKGIMLFIGVIFVSLIDSGNCKAIRHVYLHKRKAFTGKYRFLWLFGFGPSKYFFEEAHTIEFGCKVK